MAKADTFHCSVITPERVVLECEAKFVAFPAHDGELGVLTNRAPLVCKLGIGPMRIDTAAEKHVLFVDGGFAQVVENRLSILTEQACKADELNADAAERALEQARAMKIPDDAAHAARAKALQRAQIQLKLTRSRSEARAN